MALTPEWIGIASLVILFAAIFIGLFVVAQWQVAAWGGAPVHFANVAPSILVGIVCFPIAAFIAGRLDHWRMGR